MDPGDSLEGESRSLWPPLEFSSPFPWVVGAGLLDGGIFFDGFGSSSSSSERSPARGSSSSNSAKKIFHWRLKVQQWTLPCGRNVRQQGGSTITGWLQYSVYNTRDVGLILNIPSVLKIERKEQNIFNITVDFSIYHEPQNYWSLTLCLLNVLWMRTYKRQQNFLFQKFHGVSGFNLKCSVWREIFLKKWPLSDYLLFFFSIWYQLGK